jgi:hypothetical protein
MRREEGRKEGREEKQQEDWMVDASAFAQGLIGPLSFFLKIKRIY